MVILVIFVNFLGQFVKEVIYENKLITNNNGRKKVYSTRNHLVSSLKRTIN